MSEQINKRLLGALDAASYLSISRTTLYYKAKIGKIRSLKIGHRRLFPIEELDRYVDQLIKEQWKNFKGTG